MIEAMKQALEVLEDFVDDPRSQHQIDAASAALRKAIAEAEKREVSQEPVALMVVNGEISYKSIDDDQSFGMWCPVNYDSRHSFPDGTKFYTHPQPKREPLTDLKESLVEAMSIINHYGMHGWSKAAHDEGERVMKNARKALASHGIKE